MAITEIVFLSKEDDDLIYCAGCGAIRDGYEPKKEYKCRHCDTRYILIHTKD